MNSDIIPKDPWSGLMKVLDERNEQLERMARDDDEPTLRTKVPRMLANVERARALVRPALLVAAGLLAGVTLGWVGHG